MIGVHRSPNVAFVQPPWAVLEEACLSIWCQRCRPLAEAISLRVPTFEDRFFPSNRKNRLQRLRPIGANWRPILLRTDPGSVCLSLQCSKSRINASLTWGWPTGMFRSRAGSVRWGSSSSSSCRSSCRARVRPFSPKSGLPETMIETSSS